MVEPHIASCEACREFVAEQRALDARLEAMLVAPELSPGFRVALKAKLPRHSDAAWPDFLPEIAHFAGCGCAVAITAFLLRGHSGAVVPMGAAFTVATYFLQVLMRGLLEDLDEA